MQEIYTIDVEASSLLEDALDYSSFPYKLKPDVKLHCVVLKNFNTGEVFCAEQENITKEWLQQTLKDCSCLVAHNGVKYDFLILNLFGLFDYTIGYIGQKDTLFGKECLLTDTLILSRLFNPDRFGGHSLESWGMKLGCLKTDLRKAYIEKGLIDPKAPEGVEFKLYDPIMLEYCKNDVEITEKVLKTLMKEFTYNGWKQAIRLEHKLADLAIKRETFGFWFDKDLALKLVDDLTSKIKTIADKINPILPKRKMNKGELADFTPPVRQLKENGEPTTYMVNFAKNIGANLLFTHEQIDNNSWHLVYKNIAYELPIEEPLETEVQATIEDGDAVKEYLLALGWKPSMWQERDLTKDSKKKNLIYTKRIEALDRWINETFVNEKYKKYRLKIVGIRDEHDLRYKLSEKLKDNRAVIVPTSPMVRVGIERELCPNLIELGEKVEFAKDYGDYLTYRYRLASIAGGDLDLVSLDEDRPDSGYLSLVREADQRVSTPAIEIGAVSNRYIHKNIVNIPRTSSLYGKEMRSLFGAGKDFIQLGYDFSSLEARISGHYVYKYPQGKELSEMFVAEKPNDLHSRNSVKLGIDRTVVKSLTFACLPINTEVLTIDGWKKYEDLKENEPLLSFNIEKNIVEPDIILKKHFFNNKEVIKYYNKHTKFLCTKDHRWYGWKRIFINRQRVKKYGFFKAEDIKQEYNIILSAPYIGGNNNNVNSDEAFLMGLILSDGYINWSKKSEKTSCSNGKRKEVLVGIVQSTKYFTKEIEEVLKKLNINYGLHKRPNNIHHYWLYSPYGRNFLDKVVGIRKDKEDIDWVKWVISLKRKCLEQFLKGFYLGDGYKKSTKKYENYIIGQNDGNVSEGVLVAMQLLGDGVVTKRKKYKLQKLLRKKTIPHITCQELKQKNIGVQDTFCLTTKNSTFIIRQDGFLGITGNCLYGAQPPKIAKMLNIPSDKAKELYNEFWEAVPALKILKDALERHWENNNKEWIKGIDGRKIYARSPHSLLNFLFQSGGVICAKYVTVLLAQKLENLGYCIDPFKGKPDVCSMIEYHDEANLAVAIDSKLFKFKRFKTEEEGKEFIKKWDGEQLGNLSKGDGCWFITLPNNISRTIDESIKEIKSLLKLNINLAFEFAVGKNWGDVH